jgi:Ni,Fe-hydrogenase III large subunit
LGLTLRLQGETVAGVEPTRAGYARRDVVEIAAGRPLNDALAIVERLCSLSHEAHRLALCQAVERATGAKPAPAADRIRLVFAECERILARLWTLARVSRAAGLPTPAGDALEQRETLFDALQAATGQRHYWAVAIPGGVRDPDVDLALISAATGEIEEALPEWRKLVAPSGQLGIAGKGAGTIAAARAQELKLTGAAAAGSYEAADLRRTQSYGAYAGVSATLEGAAFPRSGDTAARLVYIVEDLAASLTLVRETVAAHGAASTDAKAPAAPRGAAASTAVEGPHGPIEVAATLGDDGTLAQLSVSSSGTEALLAALPEILEGCRLQQAAVILASLDLCVECLDA